MKYIIKYSYAGVRVLPPWQELKRAGGTKRDWISPYTGFREKLVYYLTNGHLSDEIHDLDLGRHENGNTYVQMVFETQEGAEDFKSFLETIPNLLSVTVEPIE